ncbi:OsmC family protein [Halanaerobium sp. Z-7514]|uniref:OsmC family protein n=1 Tax=Halanaerobium polyolivorans TaxID=2886943 RepID=A0AAW4X0C8_9FIRM|nr:OsmC family protein [Halanaerobium polyolivorans]MCC3145257.1 OsmC family protein [Halanaerobium polyolivorans]RQD70243.1 MAG: OsmC family peroxiredoxin [Halanaerobium sp. MSAO_Bac5]
MPAVNFSVSANSENPTKVVVETPGGFKITVDEPENLGGTNDGPNPVEYVLAALAGCLNVVGHMVAKEMGIEMRDLSFKLNGDLDPAKFTGQSEEGRAGYQAINVEIEADCDADEETLAKWVEAVEERCPVSDNLANETPVKITVK